MKKTIIAFIALALISLACGATESAIQTAIAQTEVARSTNTPLATSTPTPLPGVGSIVSCGDILTLKVLGPPDFRDHLLGYPGSRLQPLLNAYDPPPGSVFMGVPIEIINTSSKAIAPESLPSSIYASQAEGKLDNKLVIADIAGGGLEAAFELNYGWNAWPLEVVPGLSTKVVAVFVVNPATIDWVFVYHYQGPDDPSPLCDVRISLMNTSTTNSTPSSVLNVSTNTPDGQISCDGIEQVNIRKIPGYINKNDSDVVAKMPCGALITIVDGPQDVDGLKWWQVEWNGYTGWIAEKTNSGVPIIIFSP